MPLFTRIVAFAKSPAGQQLITEAQRKAKDPATRAQVQQLAAKVRAGRKGQQPPGS
ncbi:hypothetical protein CLV35_2381 [Motilibacter peucedani]|uniref:Uncharacterized protein n=1 Tax=Motilibacter peucedani TaxID=598650 RepID=A0A420XNX7_9ACTN|nr:hypothetical protein [Motilibacter peucedani]RKS73887.1 hypothetical protein CLV35_2381 [Motilibacter peucedani]